MTIHWGVHATPFRLGGRAPSRIRPLPALVANYRCKVNTMKEAACSPWATSVLVLAFLSRPAAASDPQAIERYRKEVQPILAKYCFDCHGEGQKRGNISF